MMSVFSSLLPRTVADQSETAVGRRLLNEYGAIYVARNGVIPPDRLIFENEEQVLAFQNNVSTGSLTFGQITIELQSVAAERLESAVAAAKRSGMIISPRSADSGRRSYADTLALWHSRVRPALDHWLAEGRLSLEEVMLIRSLSPFEQVPVVLSLEEKGIYFAKDLSKTILYSVAPPGASQHLSMLAFDVAEFDDPDVRKLLERHFWYQTVPSDLPHFTYLGVPREDLPDLGLKCTVHSEREFWVPDLDGDK